jgi:hypothetical protein
VVAFFCLFPALAPWSETVATESGDRFALSVGLSCSPLLSYVSESRGLEMHSHFAIGWASASAGFFVAACALAVLATMLSRGAPRVVTA